MPDIQKNMVGWVLTLAFMMLGWIAFRAGSVQTVFELWSKLVQPPQYTWLGMRENTYLVTLLLFLGSLVVFGTSRISANQFKEKFLLKTAADTVVLALMISSVFILLRPIKQFIYFQF